MSIEEWDINDKLLICILIRMYVTEQSVYVYNLH